MIHFEFAPVGELVLVVQFLTAKGELVSSCSIEFSEKQPTKFSFLDGRVLKRHEQIQIDPRFLEEKDVCFVLFSVHTKLVEQGHSDDNNSVVGPPSPKTFKDLCIDEFLYEVELHLIRSSDGQGNGGENAKEEDEHTWTRACGLVVGALCRFPGTEGGGSGRPNQADRLYFLNRARPLFAVLAHDRLAKVEHRIVFPRFLKACGAAANGNGVESNANAAGEASEDPENPPGQFNIPGVGRLLELGSLAELKRRAAGNLSLDVDGVEFFRGVQEATQDGDSQGGDADGSEEVGVEGSDADERTRGSSPSRRAAGQVKKVRSKKSWPGIQAEEDIQKFLSKETEGFVLEDGHGLLSSYDESKEQALSPTSGPVDAAAQISHGGYAFAAEDFAKDASPDFWDCALKEQGIEVEGTKPALPSKDHWIWSYHSEEKQKLLEKRIDEFGNAWLSASGDDAGRAVSASFLDFVRLAPDEERRAPAADPVSLLEREEQSPALGHAGGQPALFYDEPFGGEPTDAETVAVSEPTRTAEQPSAAQQRPGTSSGATASGTGSPSFLNRLNYDGFTAGFASLQEQHANVTSPADEHGADEVEEEAFVDHDEEGQEYAAEADEYFEDEELYADGEEEEEAEYDEYGYYAEDGTYVYYEDGDEQQDQDVFAEAQKEATAGREDADEGESPRIQEEAASRNRYSANARQVGARQVQFGDPGDGSASDVNAFYDSDASHHNADSDDAGPRTPESPPDEGNEFPDQVREYAPHEHETFSDMSASGSEKGEPGPPAEVAASMQQGEERGNIEEIDPQQRADADDEFGQVFGVLSASGSEKEEGNAAAAMQKAAATAAKRKQQGEEGASAVERVDFDKKADTDDEIDQIAKDLNVVADLNVDENAEQSDFSHSSQASGTPEEIIRGVSSTSPLPPVGGEAPIENPSFLSSPRVAGSSPKEVFSSESDAEAEEVGDDKRTEDEKRDAAVVPGGGLTSSSESERNVNLNAHSSEEDARGGRGPRSGPTARPEREKLAAGRIVRVQERPAPTRSTPGGVGSRVGAPAPPVRAEGEADAAQSFFMSLQKSPPRNVGPTSFAIDEDGPVEESSVVAAPSRRPAVEEKAEDADARNVVAQASRTQRVGDQVEDTFDADIMQLSKSSSAASSHMTMTSDEDQDNNKDIPQRDDVATPKAAIEAPIQRVSIDEEGPTVISVAASDAEAETGPRTVTAMTLDRDAVAEAEKGPTARSATAPDAAVKKGATSMRGVAAPDAKEEKDIPGNSSDDATAKSASAPAVSAELPLYRPVDLTLDFPHTVDHSGEDDSSLVQKYLNEHVKIQAETTSAGQKKDGAPVAQDESVADKQAMETIGDTAVDEELSVRSQQPPDQDAGSRTPLVLEKRTFRKRAAAGQGDRAAAIEANIPEGNPEALKMDSDAETAKDKRREVPAPAAMFPQGSAGERSPDVSADLDVRGTFPEDGIRHEAARARTIIDTDKDFESEAGAGRSMVPAPIQRKLSATISPTVAWSANVREHAGAEKTKRKISVAPTQREVDILPERKLSVTGGAIGAWSISTDVPVRKEKRKISAGPTQQVVDIRPPRNISDSRTSDSTLALDPGSFRHAPPPAEEGVRCEAADASTNEAAPAGAEVDAEPEKTVAGPGTVKRKPSGKGGALGLVEKAGAGPGTVKRKPSGMGVALGLAKKAMEVRATAKRKPSATGDALGLAEKAVAGPATAKRKPSATDDALGLAEGAVEVPITVKRELSATDGTPGLGANVNLPRPAQEGNAGFNEGVEPTKQLRSPHEGPGLPPQAQPAWIDGMERQSGTGSSQGSTLAQGVDPAYPVSQLYLQDRPAAGSEAADATGSGAGSQRPGTIQKLNPGYLVRPRTPSQHIRLPLQPGSIYRGSGSPPNSRAPVYSTEAYYRSKRDLHAESPTNAAPITERRFSPSVSRAASVSRCSPDGPRERSSSPRNSSVLGSRRSPASSAADERDIGTRPEEAAEFALEVNGAPVVTFSSKDAKTGVSVRLPLPPRQPESPLPQQKQAPQSPHQANRTRNMSGEGARAAIYPTQKRPYLFYNDEDVGAAAPAEGGVADAATLPKPRLVSPAASANRTSTVLNSVLSAYEASAGAGPSAVSPGGAGLSQVGFKVANLVAEIGRMEAQTQTAKREGQVPDGGASKLDSGPVEDFLLDVLPREVLSDDVDSAAATVEFGIRDLAAFTTVCARRRFLPELKRAAKLYDVLEILELNPPAKQDEAGTAELKKGVRGLLAEVRAAVVSQLPDVFESERKLVDRFFVFWSAARQVQWEEKMLGRNHAPKAKAGFRINPEGESQKNRVDHGRAEPTSLEEHYLDQVLRTRVFSEKKAPRKNPKELAAQLETVRHTEITLTKQEVVTPRDEVGEIKVGDPSSAAENPGQSPAGELMSSGSYGYFNHAPPPPPALPARPNPAELPGTRAWEDVIGQSLKKIETLFHIVGGGSDAQNAQLRTLRELSAHGGGMFAPEDAYQRDLVLLEIRELEKNVLLDVASVLAPQSAGPNGVLGISGSFPRMVLPDGNYEREAAEVGDLQKQGVRTLRRLQVLWHELDLFEISTAEADRVTMIRDLAALNLTGGISEENHGDAAKVRFLVENLIREQIQELETEVLIAWGQEMLLQVEKTEGTPPEKTAAAARTSLTKAAGTPPSVAPGAAQYVHPQITFPASSYFSRLSVSANPRKNSLVCERCSLPDKLEEDLFLENQPSQNQVAKAVGVESLENLQLALVPYEGFGNYLEGLGSFGSVRHSRRLSRSPTPSPGVSMVGTGSTRQTEWQATDVSRMFASAKQIEVVNLPNPGVCAMRRALIEQKRELETDVVLESIERRRRNLLAVKDGQPSKSPMQPDEQETTLARIGSAAVERIEALAVEVSETNFGVMQTENRVAKQDSLATAQRFVEHIYELCDSEIPMSSLKRDPKTEEITIRMNRAAMAQVQHLEADALVGLSQKILENHLTWKTGRKTISNSGEVVGSNVTGNNAGSEAALRDQLATQRLVNASDRTLARVAKLRGDRTQQETAGFVTDLTKLRAAEIQLAQVAGSMPGPQAAQLNRCCGMVHDLLQQLAVADMQAVVLRRLAESGNARQLALLDRLAGSTMMAIRDQAREDGLRASKAANLGNMKSTVGAKEPEVVGTSQEIRVHPLIRAQAVRTQARLQKMIANGLESSADRAQHLGLTARIAELAQFPEATASAVAVMLVEEMRELEAEILIQGKSRALTALGAESEAAVHLPAVRARGLASSSSAGDGGLATNVEAGCAARACTRIANLFIEEEPTERHAEMLEVMRDISVAIADGNFEDPGVAMLNDLLLSLLRDFETEIVAEVLAAQFPTGMQKATRPTSRVLQDDDASDWAFAVRRIAHKLDTLCHMLLNFVDLTSHPAIMRDVRLLQELTSFGYDSAFLDRPVLQDAALLKMRELESAVLRFSHEYMREVVLPASLNAGRGIGPDPFSGSLTTRDALTEWELDEGPFVGSLGCGPLAQNIKGAFPQLVLPPNRAEDPFLRQEAVQTLHRVQKLCRSLHMDAAALAQADRALCVQLLVFDSEVSSSSNQEKDPVAMAMSRLDNLIREEYRDLESEMLLGYGNAVLATTDSGTEENNVGFLGVSSLLPWLITNEPRGPHHERSSGVLGAVSSSAQSPPGASMPDRLEIKEDASTAKLKKQAPVVSKAASSARLGGNSRLTAAADGAAPRITRGLAGASARSSMRAMDAREDPEVAFLETQLFSAQEPTGNQYAKLRKIRELSLMDQSLQAHAEVNVRDNSRITGRGRASGLEGGDARSSMVSPSLSALRRAICDQKRELETEVVLEAMEVAEHEYALKRRSLMPGGQAALRASATDTSVVNMSAMAAIAVDRIEKCALEVGKLYEYAGSDVVEAETLSEQRRTFFHTAFHFVEHIHDLADAEMAATPSAQLGIGSGNEMVLKLNAAAARQLQHLEAQSIVSMAHNIMSHHSERIMRDARAGTVTSATGRPSSRASQLLQNARAGASGGGGPAVSDMVLRNRQNLRAQQRHTSERTLARIVRIREELLGGDGSGLDSAKNDVFVGLLPDMRELARIQLELSTEADLLQRSGCLPQSEHVDRVARMVHDVLHDVAASDLLSLIHRAAVRGMPLALTDGAVGAGPGSAVAGPTQASSSSTSPTPFGVDAAGAAFPAPSAGLPSSAIMPAGKQRLPREILQNQLTQSERRLDLAFAGFQRPLTAQQEALRVKIRDLCGSYFTAIGAAGTASDAAANPADALTNPAAGAPATATFTRPPASGVPPALQKKQQNASNLQARLCALVGDTMRELETQVYMTSAYHFSAAASRPPAAPPGVLALAPGGSADAGSPVATHRRSKIEVEENSEPMQAAKLCVRRLEQLFRESPPNYREQDLFAQCLELYDAALLLATSGAADTSATNESAASLLRSMVAQMKELQKEIVVESVQRAHERSAGGSTAGSVYADLAKTGWENINAARNRSTAAFLEGQVADEHNAANEDVIPAWMRELAAGRKERSSGGASLDANLLAPVDTEKIMAQQAAARASMSQTYGRVQLSSAAEYAKDASFERQALMSEMEASPMSAVEAPGGSRAAARAASGIQVLQSENKEKFGTISSMSWSSEALGRIAPRPEGEGAPAAQQKQQQPLSPEARIFSPPVRADNGKQLQSAAPAVVPDTAAAAPPAPLFYEHSASESADTVNNTARSLAVAEDEIKRGDDDHKQGPVVSRFRFSRDPGFLSFGEDEKPLGRPQRISEHSGDGASKEADEDGSEVEVEAKTGANAVAGRKEAVIEEDTATSARENGSWISPLLNIRLPMSPLLQVESPPPLGNEKSPAAGSGAENSPTGKRPSPKLFSPTVGLNMQIDAEEPRPFRFGTVLSPPPLRLSAGGLRNLRNSPYFLSQNSPAKANGESLAPEGAPAGAVPANNGFAFYKDANVEGATSAACTFSREALERELQAKTSKNLELYQRVFELEAKVQQQRGDCGTQPVPASEEERDAAMERSSPKCCYGYRRRSPVRGEKEVVVSEKPALLFYNDVDRCGALLEKSPATVNFDRAVANRKGTPSRESQHHPTSSASRRGANVNAASPARPRSSLSVGKSASPARRKIGFGTSFTAPPPTAAIARLSTTARKGARQEDSSRRTRHGDVQSSTPPAVEPSARLGFSSSGCSERPSSRGETDSAMVGNTDDGSSQMRCEDSGDGAKSVTASSSFSSPDAAHDNMGPIIPSPSVSTSQDASLEHAPAGGNLLQSLHTQMANIISRYGKD